MINKVHKNLVIILTSRQKSLKLRPLRHKECLLYPKVTCYININFNLSQMRSLSSPGVTKVSQVRSGPAPVRLPPRLIMNHLLPPAYLLTPTPPWHHQGGRKQTRPGVRNNQTTEKSCRRLEEGPSFVVKD